MAVSTKTIAYTILISHPVMFSLFGVYFVSSFVIIIESQYLLALGVRYFTRLNRVLQRVHHLLGIELFGALFQPVGVVLEALRAVIEDEI